MLNYKESKANVNIEGKQSLVLEGTELLNHIVSGITYNPHMEMFEPTLSVITVLCGGCCEADYIVIGKDQNDEQKIGEAVRVIAFNHDFGLKPIEIRPIVRTLMHLGLLQEKLITWG